MLLILATLGAVVLLASSHFASFFLGLEVLSVSLYGLIAYPRTRSVALEAGIKYLVLAGVTSASLLFGMALIYAVSGEMSLQALAAAVVRAGGMGSHGLLGRTGAHLHGSRVQAGAGALPSLDSRCVPGRARPGDRLLGECLEGRRLCRLGPLPGAARYRARRAVGGAHRGRLRVHDSGQRARPAAAERQEAPGLFIHRPAGLHHGRAHRRWVRRHGGPGVLSVRVRSGAGSRLRGRGHLVELGS